MSFLGRYTAEFYKRLLINIRVKCLNQGIKKSEFCLKQGRKISDICLKQGQGNRGRAAPPHQGIYRVPPSPPPGENSASIYLQGMRDRSMRSGTKFAREIQLTDWSTAENLSNASSGVQIPLDIYTRFGRYLYSRRCSWIIMCNIYCWLELHSNKHARKSFLEKYWTD